MMELEFYHFQMGESKRKTSPCNPNPLFRYYGLIKDKVPHGLGILQYLDGKFDAGTFGNGLLDGIGRMNMHNGDIYEGFVRQGELHGKVWV